MELNWSYDTDNIDWDELSMLYTIAPLNDEGFNIKRCMLK